MKTKRNKRNGKPDPAILATIIGEIVEVAKPEKIVLFGSAARGEMGPDSDYDLLVIKKGKFNHGWWLTRIYRRLSGAAAVDVVLASVKDIELYGDAHCLVYCPALKEGRVVYESKALPAKRPARVAEPRKKQLGRRKGSRPGRILRRPVL
jgi:predicted nucleotidyltransferase